MKLSVTIVMLLNLFSFEIPTPNHEKQKYSHQFTYPNNRFGFAHITISEQNKRDIFWRKLWPLDLELWLFTLYYPGCDPLYQFIPKQKSMEYRSIDFHTHIVDFGMFAFPALRRRLTKRFENQCLYFIGTGSPVIRCKSSFVRIFRYYRVYFRSAGAEETL